MTWKVGKKTQNFAIIQKKKNNTVKSRDSLQKAAEKIIEIIFVEDCSILEFDKNDRSLCATENSWSFINVKNKSCFFVFY